MPTQYVRFEETDRGNIIDLRLPTSLEAVEFDELNQTIFALLKGHTCKKCIIDLSSVSYMGSAMLGMLVNMRQRIKASGGRVLLCGLSKPLLNLFKTCCMERLFTIVKDRDAALAS